MVLDPEAKLYLDRVAAAGRPAYHALSVDEARRDYRATRSLVQPPKPSVADVVDRSIARAGKSVSGESSIGGTIPIRHYRPLGSESAEMLPALVYFHGGGWTLGDLETHDTFCREIANGAMCAVIAVDYRMGPEEPFPAAVDDCLAATRWVLAEAVALGVDASRVAIGGDSAGGNLAAVVALMMRDAPTPEVPGLCFQLLIYPITDLSLDSPSHVELAEGYMLTRANMLWYRANYLPDARNYANWRASPLMALDLSGLPPALVITAGFDPLRDEGKAYADALARASVPVVYTCYPGTIHGFIMMGGVMAAANRAMAEAAEALRRAFSVTGGD